MLKMNKITKTFPGVFRSILDDIDFTLQTGEFCVVIGANGSGKSTFLKVIAGEHVPDSGSISLGGSVTQVVQDINQGTIPAMTLLENIALSYMKSKRLRLTFYNRYRDEIIDKIKALDMGLEQYIDQPLSSLSGGQRQVIATLMAMNSGSKILLLDEHTSALDPKMQIVLMDYTAMAAKELELTTIMITHKMDDAVKYGDRLIMLHNGKIVLNIAGQEKLKLNAQDLLALFHKYEDETLLSGVKYGN